ncbi:MAG: hypothetical protein ACJ739_12170 [Acidimicrobiales bacterium]
MEDRITAFLYVELSSQPASKYAAERIPHVCALPGVERASWWSDCVPGRRDLPRRLDDAATLGLYECARQVDAVPPAPGVRGIHLRQVRPGQGILGAGPTLGLEVVLISPRRPERARELRDWADLVHIHDIAAAAPEHFTMITPYENVTGGEPRYLHLYELDTDDPEPAFQAMTPSTKAYLEQRGSAGHTFEEWAWHEDLVIDFVSTFRRDGSTS